MLRFYVHDVPQPLTTALQNYRHINSDLDFLLICSKESFSSNWDFFYVSDNYYYST